MLEYAELREAFEGVNTISTRALDRYAYAHDASHFLVLPDAVIIAKDAHEVARIFSKSTERGISLTFRSGGTSLSGQAVTDGVLVDVRRNFKGIEVIEGGAKVRVQPGVTVRQVNLRLSEYSRKIGPDPASESACTIGGVISNNSSGMSCGTSANTYNTIDSMVVVLTSGTVVDTSTRDCDSYLLHKEPDLYKGLLHLRDRVRSNPYSVEKIKQQFSMKNTMGYGVNAFLDFDLVSEILSHLVVGGEGTLGFVSEAVFRTVEAHRFASTGLVIFDSLHSANEALPALIETGAVALELMDSLSLRAAQNNGFASSILHDLEVRNHAALLVEYQASSPDELELLEAKGLRELGSLEVTRPGFLSREAKVRDNLWHLRKGLYASVAQARPSGTMALLEDVVVPVRSLADTCVELGELFDKYGYENCVIFGHAKDGNIHFMLTDDFSKETSIDRYESFTQDMVEVILGHEGSLKAEHGTGRIMAPYVKRQYGDELYSVMKEIKHLFDPNGILNPGVIINDDHKIHLKNFKTAPTVEKVVDRCVECGYCEPVCPSRDLTLTPRQRIVIRRAIKEAEITGDKELAVELTKDFKYSGLETCAVDGMCETACPVAINTGDLVKELRQDCHSRPEVATWKVLGDHWGGATRVAAVSLSISSAAPPRVIEGPNKFIRSHIGEEVLPLWTRDLPGGGLRRYRALRNQNADAVYIPSCMNSIFGPPDGNLGVQASFELLCSRAGIEVLVPSDIDSLCCGTPWRSKGFPEAVARVENRLLRTLQQVTCGGSLPVICDASSCTEGIKHAVAQDSKVQFQVFDVVEFVASRLLEKLPIQKRLNSLILHPTCSSTRLGFNDSLREIASVIAEDVYVPFEWGCCGFAGDRGLLHPELTACATGSQSSEIAERQADAYVSCNRTCELGMTRATGKQYQHILDLLEEVVRT